MTELLDAMTASAAGMLAIASAIFVVYSIDEIALLIAYAAWHVRRPIVETAAAWVRDAAQEPERRLAILLPAWTSPTSSAGCCSQHRAAGLRELPHLRRCSNDPATQKEVTALALEHSRITRRCRVPDRRPRAIVLNQLCMPPAAMPRCRASP